MGREYSLHLRMLQSHILQNGRKDIFLSERDREQFLSCLEQATVRLEQANAVADCRAHDAFAGC